MSSNAAALIRRAVSVDMYRVFAFCKYLSVQHCLPSLGQSSLVLHSILAAGDSMNGRTPWVQLKRVPTPLALLVGLLLGLLIGRVLPSSVRV